MKVYEAIAQTLREAGPAAVFGLLGDANMKYLAGYVEAGGNFVSSVHEGGAVSMADGYARTTNHAGIASVTHGPGVTNTMTAMTEAVRGRSPVLLLTGDTPARRNAVQYIDLKAAATLCGAAYHGVARADDVVDDLLTALRTVEASHRPMLFDVRYDLLDQDYAGPAPQAGVRIAGRPQADEESLDRALGLMAHASRPIVLAGRGAVLSGARDELVALADVLGAPLATTLLAKDLFRGEPFNLGVAGTVSHSAALDTITAADCVIAFGASLNQFTTAEGSLLAGKRVVQCDCDPVAIGRFARADVGLISDVRFAASGLRDRLLAAGTEPRTVLRTLELRQRLADISPRADFVSATSTSTLDVREAMVRLDELLPADRAVVTDVGRFMRAPWLYLHVGQPGSFLHTVNFGSIGLGIGTAIGAAIGRPGCLTVAVAGDGGAMMSLMEFSTAVRLNLPLALVVLDDGSYGAEYTKLADAGLDPKHSLMTWPDIAEVGRSLGANAMAVRTWAELEAAVEEIRNGRLPILIDVHVDPSVDIGILG
jgi:thiamine pyrophosphate-dependent acetolactate synthase large subunit-like protein